MGAEADRAEVALLLRRLSVEMDALGQRFADLHGLGRVGPLPHRGVGVSEVQVQRRQEPGRPAVPHRLGVLQRDAVPAQRLVGRRLVPGEEVRGETRVVVVAPRTDGQAEQYPACRVRDRVNGAADEGTSGDSVS